MPRFRINFLLCLTVACAGFLFVGVRAGYPVAFAVAIALIMIVGAVRTRGRGWFLLPRAILLLVGSIVLWFAAIDGRWIVEDCPDCHWMQNSFDCRVLGVPVWKQKHENWQAITFALRDLGVPCEHQDKYQWIKHRYWGGVICAYPCINGTYGFSTDDRYTESVARRVREIAKNDPGFGEKLRERVIQKRDYDYFWDGFMVDQMVLGAFDKGAAHEAKDWLTNASSSLKREALYGRSKITLDYVRSIYSLGAGEVILCWNSSEESRSNNGGTVSHIAIRLPVEQPQRQEFIDEISRRRFASGNDQGLNDYGQLFVWLVNW